MERILNANFICKFDSKFLHIYDDPRILPCKNSACLSCISNALDKKDRLKCPFCDSIHYIVNVNTIESNGDIQRELIENVKKITKKLVHYMGDYLEDTESKLSGANMKVTNWLEFIQSDIDVHFESIKTKLENIRIDLLHRLGMIKQQMFKEVNEIDTQYRQQCNDFDILINDIRSILKDKANDEILLERKMYECQDSIKTLAKLNSNFQSVFNNFIYKPNDWMPDEQCICDLKHFNIGNVDVRRFEDAVPELIDFKSKIDYISGLCVLSPDHFALVDSVKNEIFVFESNFSIKKKINSIENYFFDGPCAIVNDYMNNIYIADFWNKRVIVTNANLDRVTGIIERTDDCKDIYPVDMAVDYDILYVLDKVNHKIFQFKADGTYLNELIVFKGKNKKTKHLKDPTKIQIFESMIVILNDNKQLLFVSNEGELKYKIDAEAQFSSILSCFDHLFVHSNDGTLFVYKEHKSEMSSGIRNVFKRDFTDLNFDSTFMLFYNNRLLIASGGRKKLAIL